MSFTTTQSKRFALRPPTAKSTALLAALLLVAGAALAASTALPKAWGNWHYARPVEILVTDAARLVNITVPRAVASRARPDLADLRIIDDRGREVPFVLFFRRGSDSRRPLAAKLGEISFAPGMFTQVVVDCSAKTPFHNSVRVDTPKPDFVVWAEVAVSDDARQWRIVRELAPLFRFLKDSQEGVQTLRYPETNARYIRLRIFDPKELFPVTGTQVFDHVRQEPELVPVDATLAPAASKAPPQASLWETDLGSAGVPVSQVHFQVAQPEFHRSVRVFSREEGADTWTQRAQKEIYRFRQAGQLQEEMAVTFPEVNNARYWRVEVENGNDAPLDGAAPTLYAIPRHLVFRQEPGRSYRLLYGNSLANAPLYEMTRLVSREQMEGAALASLGPEETNPGYADPRPWTERHPVVLWAALVLAIAIIGVAALKALLDTA